VPLRIVRERTTALAIVASLAVGMAMFGGAVFLGQYFQIGRGYSPTQAGLLTVPVGTALDLGATAKAWTADRAAAELAARYGTGVLVELGGDLAVAGERPGGWIVRVAEREGAPGQNVTLERGGVCTSTTTIRTWRRGGRTVHHLLDPATGQPATGPWRTASVAAGSALAANTASTAAIVRGETAVEWLTTRGTAARLVGQDGAVVRTPGWPDPTAAAA